MMQVGSIVENPQKPEWGPGKVVGVRGSTLHVFFRDLPGERALKYKADKLRRSDATSDPVLDNLPSFVERGGELIIPQGRVTVAEARARFLRQYPGGFHDPSYLGSETAGERTYKWSAHERVNAAFGGGRGRVLIADDDADLAQEIGRALGGAANLLAKQEFIALREGLADPRAARRYLTTFLDLIEAGPVEGPFLAHADATASLPVKGQTHTDKWTVATILPYLARPDVFMFVKPTITQSAASALAFDIRYEPRPNWCTYHRILQMSRHYMAELADIGPRDFIDVQSFFWVTGESFGQKSAARGGAISTSTRP